MPIISNLNEYYQSFYTSYLSERYEHLWHMYVEGYKMAPVLTKKTVEALFNISLDDNYTGLPFPRGNTFEPTCEVQGPYVTFELLSVVAQKYKLTHSKTYGDLKVAYSLCLYNSELIDKLPLFADTMYNAVQLHKEFVEAVLSYYNSTNNAVFKVDDVNISVEVNPQNGICYKELIDYLHYKGPKPAILFVMTIGNLKKKCVIKSSDYDADFSETSYNINIHFIDF